MYKKITAGETVNFYVSISDEDGKEVDPDGLEFYIKRPDAVIQSYTLGVGTDITKDSTGNYSIELTMAQVGTYQYKWKTSAPGISIEEGSIKVGAPVF